MVMLIVLCPVRVERRGIDTGIECCWELDACVCFNGVWANLRLSQGKYLQHVLGHAWIDPGPTLTIQVFPETFYLSFQRRKENLFSWKEKTQFTPPYQ